VSVSCSDELPGEVVKLLLSLSLIVTQLLATGAVPVYVCFGCDGSITVDQGPESCKCRVAGDDGESVPCCGHSHHRNCHSGSKLMIATDDCGCVHLPVSIPGTPTRVSARSPVEHAKFAPVNVTGVPQFDLSHLIRVDWKPRLDRIDRPASGALRDLGTVILRC
jgi:hypothetical protein